MLTADILGHNPLDSQLDTDWCRNAASDAINKSKFEDSSIFLYPSPLKVKNL